MSKIIFRNLTNVKFQQLKNVISKDKNRPHLRGVFLDTEESRIVVTDSQILMIYDIEILNEDFLEKEILMDAKIFNQTNWLSVPKDDLELVEFHVTEEKTEVRLGEDVVAVAKNMDVENCFPRYKHVLADNEEVSEFCVSVDNLKRLSTAIPAGFSYPKFKVGRMIHVECTGEHSEFGEMSIKGIAMTVGFGEDEITNETEEVELKRDNDGKIIQGQFKKLEGKKLSRRVLNTWEEDFVDEDTGDIVPIERNEIIVDKNTIIDSDVWERINSIKTINYLFIHKYNN